MGLLDALRAGVATANAVTKDLQSTVQYTRCTGGTGYGAGYAPPIPLRAIVEQKQRQVRTPSGTLETSTATITFLDVTALVLATNGNGISDQDLLALPDKSGGAILGFGGFIDAGTGKPLATEVYIG